MNKKGAQNQLLVCFDISEKKFNATVKFISDCLDAELALLFFVAVLINSFQAVQILYEPRREKACLRGFRPGSIQTGM